MNKLDNDISIENLIPVYSHFSVVDDLTLEHSNIYGYNTKWVQLTKSFILAFFKKSEFFSKYFFFQNSI